MAGKVDMFLEFEGQDPEGETLDSVKSAVKAIDLDGFEFGATQSGTMHTATGGGSGKASVQDLKCEKFLDKASMALFRAVCDGRHFKKAKLTVRKAGQTPLEYFILEMSDVIVTSYQIGGTEEDERVRETVHLNFSEMVFKYVPQKKDGTGDTPKNFTYLIAQNKVA